MRINGNIVVIGDVMLDVYISGQANRLSPEAPVPIVDVDSKCSTLGGAGNVALNLVGLGCRVWLFGARGSDHLGSCLSSIVRDRGIVDCLDIDPVLPTTAKTRVLANNQQLLRIDEEGRFNGYHGCYDCIISEVAQVMAANEIGAVVISDYNKGVVSREVAVQVIKNCRASGIPVLVDPKYGDWSVYAGATLIKPNLAELGHAFNMRVDKDIKKVIGLAHSLMKSHNLESVLVTMGPRGMLVVDGYRQEHIPSLAKEVFDVSGAGDTVIATVAACLCSGYELSAAARISNVAAGIVVGKLGTAPITMKELMAELT